MSAFWPLTGGEDSLENLRGGEGGQLSARQPLGAAGVSLGPGPTQGLEEEAATRGGNAEPLRCGREGPSRRLEMGHRRPVIFTMLAEESSAV